MGEDTGLRGLVLDAALALALRVVDRSEGLDQAMIEERFDVGDGEWHLTATYSRQHDAIRVSGHPHRAPSVDGEEGGGIMAILFGPAGTMFTGSAPGSFDFQVPTAWLRSAAVAPR